MSEEIPEQASEVWASMDFDPNNFRTVKYGTAQLYFDRASPFHEHFQHKRQTRTFPFYRNIIEFLAANPETKIYFTLNEAAPSFRKEEGECLLVNMHAYQKFCDAIGTKTGGRFQAFIGQHYNLRDVAASPTERASYVRANATQADLIDVFRKMAPEGQQEILASLSTINSADTTQPTEEISSDELIAALARFLKDKNLQRAIYDQLPKVQLDTLKSHVAFLRENLHQNETFIQNWLDEEGGKYRKQRCLIFGLQYTDPIREGQVAGKRFDILAEQDLQHHVIFELKSPKDDIFKVVQVPTAAGGTSTEYHLSQQLSRAIPEVLGYKKMYEHAQAEELGKLGIKHKKPVSKCVIVLGTCIDDQVWRDNFDRVCATLSGIELLTYNHLIDRLDNTIRNLEENTRTI